MSTNGSKSILPYPAAAKSLAAFAKVSVLGPLLFNVFFNDVTDSLDPSTTAKLFEDDIKLYSSFSKLSPSNLQSQLNIIQLWSSTWQLKISHSKCNILPIGPHLTNNTFHIDNIDISTVEHSIDLGITIDSKLFFHQHINNIVCKANQRKSLILRCFLSRSPSNLVYALSKFTLDRSSNMLQRHGRHPISLKSARLHQARSRLLLPLKLQ